MLRVYAAAHGMSSKYHAVVEVGAEEIVLRVDTHWTRFTHNTMETSTGERTTFRLNEDGSVDLGSTHHEMDMGAEWVARTTLAQADLR